LAHVTSISAGIAHNLALIKDNSNNQLPEIQSFVPNSAWTMDAGTNQTFSVAASDPEGLPLHYRWEWKGAPVGSDSATLSLQTAWADAGSNQLVCWVSDDYWVDAASALWNVTVRDDNDGDGMKNIAERIAGTNPNDAASIFVLSRATSIQSGQLMLQWSGLENRTYQILSTTNLFDGSWVNEGSPVIGSNGTMQITLPLHQNSLYFKLRVTE
jgi:hypothetical protein